jgi:hypothetical protein
MEQIKNFHFVLDRAEVRGNNAGLLGVRKRLREALIAN